jgi:hypothetical protein
MAPKTSRTQNSEKLLFRTAILPLSKKLNKLLNQLKGCIFDLCKNYWLNEGPSIRMYFVADKILSHLNLETYHILPVSNHILELPSYKSMKENRDRFGSTIVKCEDIILLFIPDIELKSSNSHTLKFEQHIYSGNCVKVFLETLGTVDANPALAKFILYSLNSSRRYICENFGKTINSLSYKLLKERGLIIQYRPGFYYQFVEGKFVLGHAVDFWLAYTDYKEPCFITYRFSNDELNLLIKEKKIRKLIDKLTRNTHSSMLIHTRECLKRFGV